MVLLNRFISQFNNAINAKKEFFIFSGKGVFFDSLLHYFFCSNYVLSFQYLGHNKYKIFVNLSFYDRNIRLVSLSSPSKKNVITYKNLKKGFDLSNIVLSTSRGILNGTQCCRFRISGILLFCIK